jgi:hypothetical protein
MHWHQNGTGKWTFREAINTKGGYVDQGSCRQAPVWAAVRKVSCR